MNQNIERRRTIEDRLPLLSLSPDKRTGADRGSPRRELDTREETFSVKNSPQTNKPAQTNDLA